MLASLKRHVQKVVGHFKNTRHIIAIDVVNEALGDDQSGIAGQYKFKNNDWYPLIPDYVFQAFKFASQSNSRARLAYNDYNLHVDSKFTALVAMIKDMQSKAVPIHVVGYQMRKLCIKSSY